MLKKLIRKLVQPIFNEGWAQVKREIMNDIYDLQENLDRIEKNADRRYHEMRRVDIKLKELDK